jgi:DNA-binding NarL/FixJ family response regulator
VRQFWPHHAAPSWFPIVSDVCSFALVADDDAFFRIALSALLSWQLGFETVIEAETLDDARDPLGTRPEITLTLFDLSMPGMKHAARLSAVRECAPDVPVAAVSASITREDILGALGVGIHGYIPKGSGTEQLCQALDMVLAYVPPILANLPQRSARPSAPPAARRSRTLPCACRRPARSARPDRGRPAQQEIARRLRLGGGHGEDPCRCAAQGAGGLEPCRSGSTGRAHDTGSGSIGRPLHRRRLNQILASSRHTGLSVTSARH